MKVYQTITWRCGSTPIKVDEQITQKIQILPCNVIGSCDESKGKPVFVLQENYDVIISNFPILLVGLSLFYSIVETYHAILEV